MSHPKEILFLIFSVADTDMTGEFIPEDLEDLKRPLSPYRSVHEPDQSSGKGRGGYSNKKVSFDTIIIVR